MEVGIWVTMNCTRGDGETDCLLDAYNAKSTHRPEWVLEESWETKQQYFKDCFPAALLAHLDSLHATRTPLGGESSGHHFAHNFMSGFLFWRQHRLQEKSSRGRLSAPALPDSGACSPPSNPGLCQPAPWGQVPQAVGVEQKHTMPTPVGTVQPAATWWPSRGHHKTTLTVT